MISHDLNNDLNNDPPLPHAQETMQVTERPSRPMLCIISILCFLFNLLVLTRINCNVRHCIVKGFLLVVICKKYLKDWKSNCAYQKLILWNVTDDAGEKENEEILQWYRWQFNWGEGSWFLNFAAWLPGILQPSQQARCHHQDDRDRLQEVGKEY